MFYTDRIVKNELEQLKARIAKQERRIAKLTGFSVIVASILFLVYIYSLV